ncbi:hypothetical protein [Actinomadura parmotrematis]|uniref:Uncharacterized protein n=1 Tax=Actinomadura parmotrematis TaxID=2864039 RepID=A0ABS7FVG5_9ACTN|nr:hypothetical protein [Actinomadura parmotrematis]MBW8484398.1 hypothetical protein [Actinomadura parmotrematis]
MAIILALTAAASVLASLLLVPRTRPPDPVPGRAVPPLAGFAAVTALFYLNQVLFTVYVARVHGGDPSFVARYLPSGWFALADLDGLARHVPAPGLLAPTVLRVQAFLELPLVLLAYATVVRWLDDGLYRRLFATPVVWAASASWTLTFCLIEAELRNPWTDDDIAIRIVSGVVTPLLLNRMARRGGPSPASASVAGLLLFTAATWALGQLVLTLYDTALIYNLGHLGGRLPGALAAVAVLAVVLPLRRRVRAPADGDAGPGRAALALVAGGLGQGLALFFVPALSVRYGVRFGAAPYLVMVAILLATAAVATLRASPGRFPTARTAAGALAGAAAAYAAVRLVTDPYYEAGLLRGLAAGFAVLVAVAGVRTPRRRAAARRRSSPTGGA